MANEVLESQPQVAQSDLSILDAALAKGNASADSDKPAEVVSEEVKPDEAVAEPEVKIDDAKAPEAEIKSEVPEETGLETPLSVTQINDLLKMSPAIKAEIDKNPSLKSTLFYTARRAERAGQYDELFGTPILAKDAAEAAKEQYEFREVFDSTSPEDSKKLFEKLMFNSLERDGEGKIKIDAYGRPVSSGAYERHMSVYRHSVYDEVSQMANQMIASGQVVGDITGQDVSEAIRILKTVVEGSASPAQANIPNDLPESVKAELAGYRAQAKASEQSQNQMVEGFKAKAIAASHDQLAIDVKAVLDQRLPKNTAISEYIKEAIIADTVRSIEQNAMANAAHQNVLSRAIRQAAKAGTGPLSIVAMQAAFAKELIPKELAKILQKVTGGIVASSKAVIAKAEMQMSRPDIQAQGGVANPSRPDVKAEVAKRMAEAKASGKRFNEMDLIGAAMDVQRPIR